jgi:hypothetical protein
MINETELNINSNNGNGIFRYKFTDEFTEVLCEFSKIHQYDDVKTFKEAWTTWVEEHTDIVEDEISRLNRSGYNNDILKKMFVSARYYYRKKDLSKSTEQKPRGKYISVSQEMLIEMDKYIQENPSIQPKIGFENFCNSNVELIKSEVKKLYKSGITDVQEIKKKVKKTYNNRYFVLVKK